MLKSEPMYFISRISASLIILSLSFMIFLSPLNRRSRPTNRILSAVSPRVKVEISAGPRFGEHCGRNAVGRNRGGAMGIEWSSRLALRDAAEEGEVAGGW